MPLVTAFNLRRADPLAEIEQAIRQALTSMPELLINDHEVDLVPVLAPDSLDDATTTTTTTTTRINVDLWERQERTKEALQELAGRVAEAFQAVTDSNRTVKVVIRPYDIGRSGWVSL
jgi:phenylpyruvate tautomerase PptA (4-oxalocrotonate tautomerase family)